MVRLRYRGNGRGWVYATARDESEADRMIAGLEASGYRVERL